MTLLKRRINKPGLERYYDYFMVWYYNDKMYSVLIKPTFREDYKLLSVNAQEVPTNVSLEDYMKNPLLN